MIYDTRMKHYMITNEKEIHNGYQLSDGLNVVNGTACLFQFTDKRYILDHIKEEDMIGHWIREVIIPDPESVICEDTRLKTHSIILDQKKKIDLNVIKKFIYLDRADKTIIMEWAIENGSLDVLQYIVMQGVDINYALTYSVIHGQLELVEYLINRGAEVRPDYLLRLAIINCRPGIVKYLKHHKDFKSWEDKEYGLK